MVANAIVATPLLVRLVNSSPNHDLRYQSAWTIWPGRVHVRDLRVRFQDYNVEVLISAEKAELDVSLYELAFRKFHASRVRTYGTSPVP